jgi:hypothetical protein
MGAQHLDAVAIPRQRMIARNGRRERRLHLLQARKVGAAQDAAEVRIGDQLTAPVDHKRVAAVRNFDLRDHVPDELQINVGCRHPAPLARSGKSHRDVRLRLLTKGHRAEIAALVLGFGKDRFARAVGVAAHDIEREPRNAQLLAPGLTTCSWSARRTRAPGCDARTYRRMSGAAKSSLSSARVPTPGG